MYCCVNMGLLICLSEGPPCFHFFHSISVRYLSSSAHVSILVQTGDSVCCMLISAHKSGGIVMRSWKGSRSIGQTLRDDYYSHVHSRALGVLHFFLCVSSTTFCSPLTHWLHQNYTHADPEFLLTDLRSRGHVSSGVPACNARKKVSVRAQRS